MNAPERIRAWVEREFAQHYVDRVVADLIEVATGNRAGNAFELAALHKLFPDWTGNGPMFAPHEDKQCAKCLAPVNVMGRDRDGKVHPGKACKPIIAASYGRKH